MEKEELKDLIEGCLRNDRQLQKKLYKAFYGFVYGIALRYANDEEEASIIINKGFYCAFAHLSDYKETTDFKEWLRHLIVQASIKHYFDTKRFTATMPVSKIGLINYSPHNLGKAFSYSDNIRALHQLPGPWRMIFNLFAIEGYQHEKIASLLDISAYTSESLLVSARKKLSSLMND